MREPVSHYPNSTGAALDTGSPHCSVQHDGKRCSPRAVIPHKCSAMRDPEPHTRTSPLDTGSPLCSVRHDGKRCPPAPSSRTSIARCGNQNLIIRAPQMLHWTSDIRIASSGLTAEVTTLEAQSVPISQKHHSHPNITSPETQSCQLIQLTSLDE